MLKKLLLLAAIVAIIPLKQENQAELYKVAKSTVADISGFCQRNPGVCQKSHEVFDTLATKAEAGARMMIEIARNPTAESGDRIADLLKSPPHRVPASASQSARLSTTMATTISPTPARSNERFPAYRDRQYNEHYGRSANTLNASDLSPLWRGHNRQE